MPRPASGAPAKAATMPRPSEIAIGARPARSISSVRIMWPPLRWPVSCAMTPNNWFGLSASMIRPVLRPMTRRKVEKAFRSLEAISR